jgi:DNA repair protein RecN (Recombination protein N)
VGLKRIVLRDFVIVDELDLDLESGFTVLTGETGAGKSILIDALQLVTGARADVGVIREGAQRTDVSAEFDSPDALSSFLEDAGFECSESLLLRRTVDLTGKSRAWVNGSPATAQQLRHLGEYLLDIHGQHAWQSLTRPDAVRGLLDGYAQISTQKLSASWQQWRQAQNTLAQALQAQDSLQQEQERLAWQIGELEKLNPQELEWEALNANHSRLAHAQTLMDAAQAAVNFMEDEEGNALKPLNAALQQLQHQVHLDADFQSPIDALVSSLAQIEDAAHSLRSYLRRTELDPQGLAELDARLALWISLARRYKRSPEELPALLSSWRDALAALAAAADIEGLKSFENQTHKAYLEQAKLISKARAKAAPLLADAITQAMQGLGMQGGQFQVALEPLGQAQQSGLEDIVFLVAGHAGSTPRPVGKVASGGELSRMALAIAVTTSQLGTAQTLIFDEVDAGVGGTVAHTVGQLMRKLGRDRQVLAVTHLPQVAACADNHWVVSKRLQSGTTVSTVSAVTDTLRTYEIARMLGGDASSKTTIAHAQEMLARSAA